MQKFSVATRKGFIHTNDFSSALKILEMEFEERKRQLQEEKRKSQEWDQQFRQLLEDYIPKTKEELLQKKYEGR